MARYVKVVDGTVVNVVNSETLLNPPWYQSDTAQIGWLMDGDTFYEPEIPNTPRIISAIEFLNRFTIGESILIRSSADPHVKEWVRRVDDPRLLDIDLNRQEVTDGLSYLVSLDLLSEMRMGEIIS